MYRQKSRSPPKLIDRKSPSRLYEETKLAVTRKSEGHHITGSNTVSELMQRTEFEVTYDSRSKPSTTRNTEIAASELLEMMGGSHS